MLYIIVLMIDKCRIDYCFRKRRPFSVPYLSVSFRPACLLLRFPTSLLTLSSLLFSLAPTLFRIPGYAFQLLMILICLAIAFDKYFHAHFVIAYL